MKKNIVIVGYPKSGTTWLSRLVAELVECPLKGNWGYSHLTEDFAEGEKKESIYNCYKSHHLYKDITKVEKESIYRIIYIVRDPRDVVISGLHYFQFLPKINKILPKWYKKKKMIDAVLKGNLKINPWLIAWEKHVLSYKDKDILTIKYEDLLDNSFNESIKILNFIEINKTEKHIRESIRLQSFSVKKEGQPKNKRLRLGKTKYWEKEFNTKEKNIFIEQLGSYL